MLRHGALPVQVTIFLDESQTEQTQLIAAAEGGIKLFNINAGEITEGWGLSISCNRHIQVVHSNASLIIVLAEDNLLFVDRITGRLLAKSNLTQAGAPNAHLLAGRIMDGNMGPKDFAYMEGVKKTV